MRRIERKQGSAVTTGSRRGERRTAVNLADFPRELPCAMGGDWRLLVKAIPAQNVDRAIQHKPDGRIPIPRGEDNLTRRKIPRRTACEPACRLNLDRCQDGEYLVPALSGTVCVLLDHMSVLLARAESGGFIAKSRQLREVWRWFA